MDYISVVVFLLRLFRLLLLLLLLYHTNYSVYFCTVFATYVIHTPLDNYIIAYRG